MAFFFSVIFGGLFVVFWFSKLPMVYSGPVEELGYGRTCDNQKKMSISSQLINVLISKVTLAYAQNIFPTSPPKQVNLIVQWIKYKYTNTGPLFTPDD